VNTDEGLVGVGSGDTMDGFERYEELFIGTDPLNIVDQVRRIETINFHASRFWPLEVALWDIIGKAANLPVARLFGGARQKLLAYASTGELRDPRQRAESALAIRDAGFRAIKIRMDPREPATGLAAVAAVRDAVGASLEIMVDLNQSWRMAGDTQFPHDYAAARRIVEQLREMDVFWDRGTAPLRRSRRAAQTARGDRHAGRRRRDDLLRLRGPGLPRAGRA
jgi:D-galactarolactone cycloisomerase